MLSNWSGGNTTAPDDTSAAEVDNKSDQSEVFYHHHQNDKPLATSSKIIETSTRDSQKCVTFNTVAAYDNGTLVRSAYEWTKHKV